MIRLIAQTTGWTIGRNDVKKINADGGMDTHFGPKSPEGYEKNRILTGGKVPLPIFRFYGPAEAMSDKTFILSDIELVK